MQPQLPGFVPPPHVQPGMAQVFEPQSSLPPQVSPAGPQLKPWSAQVCGVHVRQLGPEQAPPSPEELVPQRLGPSPPQNVPSGQVPH